MKNMVRTRNTITIRIISLTAIIVFLLTALFLAGCPTDVDDIDDPLSPKVISIDAIPGVTAPVTGAAPKTAITTNQYTGKVTWEPAVPSTGFAASTVYTATITLTPKAGYTLQGIPEDFFTVAGANTVNNEANSGVITAVFPSTHGTVENPSRIDIKAIPGVTPPATGATPVTAITETAQYTGSVSWSPPVPSNGFAAGQIYIASINLTPKAGYTFTDVAADFFTVAEATLVSNAADSGFVTAIFPPAGIPATVITIANIQGVTAPVADATPVTEITENNQYTGEVKWDGAPTTFAASTVYTATITLTPKEGYTFTGVKANFFKVAGATTVINIANSGVIIAVFPSTPAIISIKKIEGVFTAPDTVPVTGKTAIKEITANAQYTGTIEWSPELYAGKFVEGTPYTATITLTPKTGYTIQGVAENFFTVAEATTVSNSANSGVITATFPKTAGTDANPTMVDIKIINVNKPVLGSEQSSVQVTGTSQFGTGTSSTIEWMPNETAGGDGKFKENKMYIAAITLTAETGFTFSGVAANFFEVPNAVSANNPAGTNNTIVITANFGTVDKTIDIDNIPDVTPPATGATPVTAITTATQYTGTVTWQGALSSENKFKPGVQYTATITLTAKNGYTLQGVEANFFKVTRATATNSANSGVVTAVFPAFFSDITDFEIKGVTLPSAGEVPKPIVNTENLQYDAAIQWPNTTPFAAYTSYTATITLTPKDGFQSKPNTSFTIKGAPTGTTVSQSSTNNNLFSVTFLKTELVIDDPIITGITAPVKGGTPTTTDVRNNQCNITNVTWIGNPTTFAASTVYKMTMTMTVNNVTKTLYSLPKEFFTVNGATTELTYNTATKVGTVIITFPKTGDPTVDIKEITGVTAPVTGATPVTAITATAQYTGTVSWNGSPITFAAKTVYTATITLTPKIGYTLDGVEANFFTVAGATTTTGNLVNSGNFTVKFPSTAGTTDAPVIIDIAAIPGVTPPAINATPVKVITETAQYTGTVIWNNSPTTFAANTVYTATITLTPKTGYKLQGVTPNFFTVAGATATNSVDSGVITAKFPAIINIAAITGIIAPVAGAMPVTENINETTQYFGTVAWNGSPATFAANTVYTATITLTAKTSDVTKYTLQGVAANFFTVAGATATNPINSGVITVTFPKTAATVNMAAIGGVTAPVAGAVPKTAITETAQYTGTISWNGNPAAFAANTVYTATITLTPKTNYTLYGVTANFFSVAGAPTVTNSANTGVIIATFTATAATVTENAITGVTVPETGATAATKITNNSVQYDGTVTWTPTLTGGKFAAATVYKATITLTEKTGYTLYGITNSGFFTVDGATTTYNTDTKKITAEFPITATTVNINAIEGVTAPVAGKTPVGEITQNDQYTGSVSWTPSVSSNFIAGTTYVATINLTPKIDGTPKYTLYGVTANFFNVAGANTVSNAANAGVITATFPAAATTVNIKAITGVTAPVTGATPVPANNGSIDTAQYTGKVTWSPNDPIFKAATDYTATITLTAKSGFTFQGVVADSFTVTGVSGTNLANTGGITVVFPKTDATITDLTLTITSPSIGDWANDLNIDNTQYQGTGKWYKMDNTPVGTQFATGTQYKVVITLTAKPGYTLYGLTQNSFTVTGAATTTYNLTTKEITATFPATATE